MINKHKNVHIIVLMGIIMLGVGLRLWFVRENMHSFMLYGDAKNYFIMSHQIVDDGVFGYGFGNRSGVPNALVTPGYPLFLSAVYVAFHNPYLQITVVRFLQALIGGFITPLFAYLLVRKVFGGRDVALLTTYFTAVYPTYIESTFFLLTEVLSLATMLIYFYITAVTLLDRKPYFGILAGAAFAIHILIRPAMLPLLIVPFVFMIFTLYKNNKMALVKAFFITVAGFVIAMLPWWGRNYFVLNKVILTTTGSGNPLLAGTYPNMENLFFDAGSEIMKNSGTQAAYAKVRIIRGFTSEPLLYLKWYTIGKLQVMFDKPWLYIQFPQHWIFHNIFHYLLLWGGLIGIIINSIMNKAHRYINLYGLMFLSLYLVFIPVNRYVYQHMFFFMLAVASMICYFWEKGIMYLKRAN